MFLKFLIFVSLSSSAFAASDLTPEQLAFSEKIVSAMQSGNAGEYKKLIHSKCPVDEAKVSNVMESPWTKRYQVKVKMVNDSFDPTKIKFEVKPEYVLEFQVWTKITNPARIKMMKGATEMESIKVFPVAKEESSLKILEWPCFGPI